MASQEADDGVDHDAGADEHPGKRQHHSQPERRRGEAGHAEQGQAQHLRERVSRGAGRARIPVIEDLGLAAAEPGHHAAQVAILLGHGVEPLDDPS